MFYLCSQEFTRTGEVSFLRNKVNVAVDRNQPLGNHLLVPLSAGVWPICWFCVVTLQSLTWEYGDGRLGRGLGRRDEGKSQNTAMLQLLFEK